MARKAGNKKGEIEVCKHDDARKNAVPAGLASYDTSKLKQKKYAYDPHLEPQLIWAGKAEHAFFEVPAESQAFFPDSTAWDKLKKALKLLETKTNSNSSPAPAPRHLSSGLKNASLSRSLITKGNEAIVVREVRYLWLN